MIDLDEVVSIKYHNKNVVKMEDTTGIMWEYQVNKKGLNFNSWPAYCTNNELINNYSVSPHQIAEDVWFDGTDVRYDNGSKSYKLTVADGWVEVGNSTLYGRYIWTDGTNIYYDELNVSKKYNKSGGYWSNHSWIKGTGAANAYVDGRYVWTDGTDFYCHFHYGIQSSYICCKIDISTRTITKNSNITALLKSDNIFGDGNQVFKYNNEYYWGWQNVGKTFKLVRGVEDEYPSLVEVTTGPLARYGTQNDRLAIRNNYLYYINLKVDNTVEHIHENNCKVYSPEYEEWMPVVFTGYNSPDYTSSTTYIWADDCIDYNIGYIALNKVCKPRGEE